MKTEYFNEDKLGRVLDELYRRGLNEIFMSIVLEAVKIYQLETSTVHLDSTSFHVHGDDHTDEDIVISNKNGKLFPLKLSYSKKDLSQSKLK